MNIQNIDVVNSRRKFLKKSCIGALTLSSLPLISLNNSFKKIESLNPTKTEDGRISIRLLRHATLIIEYYGHKILVDPMLLRDSPILIAPLQISDTQLNSILNEIDFILLSHLHSDHFGLDSKQQKLLKKKPLFCQKSDAPVIMDNLPLEDVRPVEDQVTWEDITIHRTNAQHGVNTGWISSGYVIQKKEKPSIYIAGDTIWFDGVSETLSAYNPEIIVLNSGAVGTSKEDPWTMDSDDVIEVCKAAPKSKIIAVHLEAHPLAQISRNDLRTSLSKTAFKANVHIPPDDETMFF